jgi:hypothetical protein
VRWARQGFRARQAVADHWLVYSVELALVQAVAADHWLVYLAALAALALKEFGRLHSRAHRAAWAPSSATWLRARLLWQA